MANRVLLKHAGAWLLGILLFMFTTVTYANSYEQGREAYVHGDYQQALTIWQELATSGDVNAQFGIGALYAAGLGVTQDHAEARKWFEMAALQGFPPAQFNLGNTYRHGRGVAQDDKKAAMWWQMAAIQNFAPAQYNLATAYYFGRGVPKNEHTALQWYQNAAQNNYEPALQQLEAIRQSLLSTQQSEESTTPDTNGDVSINDSEMQPSNLTASADKADEGSMPLAADETGSSAINPLPHVVNNVVNDVEKHTPDQPLNTMPATAAGRTSSADCTSTAWILSQPGANYTIQLLASNNEKQVLRYIKQHPLTQELNCFRFNRDGDDWYSVIYKSFTSYSLAKAGLEELSSIKAKPWIRKFSGIHKLIDKASTE